MSQSDSMTTSGDPLFLRELERLGPDNPPQAWELPAAQAYCRQWSKRQYENFSVVSILLPRRLRQDFYNVYCYCRWSDNLADEVGSAERSIELLHWWAGQLQLCYSGRPAHPVLVALQQTVQKFHIPIQPFQDLLSAFRQDQSVKRYEDDDSLLDYCRRSADPVGRILLHFASDSQVLSPDNLKLSDSICTGLQLANFCQDMARDAAMDRIYLPRARWDAVSEEEILSSRPSDALRCILEKWVGHARQHFEMGAPLVDQVPRWLAIDIELFIRGGVEILRKIEQADFDVWTSRPVVSKLAKLKLLTLALTKRALPFLRVATVTPDRKADHG